MISMLSFVGASGSGKTTLLEKIIAYFTTHHISVGVLKSSHHTLTFDTPGKDSDRFRKAGANTVGVASPTEFLYTKTIGPHLAPESFLPYFSMCNLLLLEGFTHASIPKIEVWRNEHSPAPIAINDPYVIAIVTDDPVETALPVFSFSQFNDLITFITQHVLSKDTNV